MLLPYEYHETEEYERGFAEYYQKHIVPLAAKYEPVRRRKRILHFGNIGLALGAGLGGSWMILKSSWFLKGARRGGQILFLPPVISWWVFVRRPRNNYFKVMKKEVVPLVLKFIGNFTYQTNQKLPKAVTVRHTGHGGLLAKSISCEDHIIFHHNNIQCEIYEYTQWHIWKRTGKLFMLFTAQYYFAADVVIFSKAKPNEDGFHYKELKYRRSLKKCNQFINHTFCTHFELYLPDFLPNQNLDWITEEFTNNLLELNSTYDREGLVFSIKNDSVCVQMENALDLFEPGKCYSVPAINAHDIKQLLGELHYATKLAEYISHQIMRINQ